MRHFILAVLMLCLPGVAQANDFAPVRDKEAFLSLVKDKDLRIGLYNLTLKVTPDGKITGSALGWDISGNWKWEDGYFCRDFNGKGLLGYDCQTVELRQDTLRFRAQQGNGDTLDLRLR